MKSDFQTVFKQQQTLIEKAILKLAEIHQKMGMQTLSPTAQEEGFEILTSRFARLSDLYTQKLLGLLFRVLQEPDLSFIDKCHRLEKLDLIDSAKVLYDIRELRNKIAHEYALSDLREIQEATKASTQPLIKITEKTIRYLEQTLKTLST